jgi:hypothetical protein
VARRSHYYWLENAGYVAAFEDVREELADRLEAEARRRAVEGIEKPIFCKGKTVLSR